MAVNESDVLRSMIETQELARVIHWTTRSYPDHMAFGEFYEELQDLVDDFVEDLQSRTGRVDFRGGNVSLEAPDDHSAQVRILEDFRSLLERDAPRVIPKGATNLANIRDEMLSLVDKTLYRLTLS